MLPLSESDFSLCVQAHDTTAAGMSWALYLLGRHPEIQDKLYEEVEQFCGKIKEEGQDGSELGFVSVRSASPDSRENL